MLIDGFLDFQEMSLDCLFAWFDDCLIPIRILNTHIEMRKSHHGRNTFFVISQFIESLAEHFNEGIKRWKDPVMKILLPQFFPQMLNWIDLRTIGRLLDQTNVRRNNQLFGAMPACLIDLHHNEILCEGLAHMREKEIHHDR